ncbi:MAG: amino acid ABC transporter permease [Spirochaetaceae bacterium]|nr:amino acid ABC transporter permease [Spirochaetaceae bacterium]MBQ8562105.1 amino acid ABC transporter permease [Spirochaetaceae bacterium]MBR2361897.1 amino acid ABC transporter permease [Spirochaetaceae bacterium]
MNIDFMVKYLPWYVDAAILTVRIALWGILLSLLVGAACAVVRYYRIPVLRRLVSLYVEVSRNTPLLVQLFFLYFGLPKMGVVLSSEVCAVIGLTFLGGSYMAESFRSGLESIEPAQLEAAASLGMGRRLTMAEVVFPQAMAVSVPGLCANVIFLIKETSVVSGIALADLMYVTKDLIGLYYETDEALTMLVVFYLIILLPVSVAASILERRLRHAGFGN